MKKENKKLLDEIRKKKAMNKELTNQIRKVIALTIAKGIRPTVSNIEIQSLFVPGGTLAGKQAEIKAVLNNVVLTHGLN